MSPASPTIEALPAFSDNYIWRFVASDGVWLVDPGDPQVVRQHLGQDKPLAGILITHHHPDHIGGLSALPTGSSVSVIAPRDPRIGHATRRVGEGDRVQCGEWLFEVWEVPGHTRSHIAFLAGDTLFCGDTLFSLGCGRLFEGSPTQMLASLSRIAALPDATRAFATHEYTLANGRFAETVEPGNADLAALLDRVRALRERGEPSVPTTIAVEKRCNPFLRCHLPTVKRAVERRLATRLQSELEVFTALRQWKDVF